MGKSLIKYFAKLSQGNERWNQGTEFEIKEEDVDFVLKNGYQYEDFVNGKIVIYPCTVEKIIYERTDEYTVGTSEVGSIIEKQQTQPPFNFSLSDSNRKVIPEGYGEY